MYIPGMFLKNHYVGTLILSPLDQTAKIPRRVLGDIALPPDFNNRGFCTPVKDQGRKGSCVGFGGCSTRELALNLILNHMMQDLPRILHNPRHIAARDTNDRSESDCYAKARKYDGLPDEMYPEGSTILGGVLGMFNEGTCHEKYWPYSDQDAGEPLPGAQADAAANKISEYALVIQREEIHKTQLTLDESSKKIELPLISFPAGIWQAFSQDVLQLFKEAIYTHGCLYGGTLVHHGWRWVTSNGIIPFNRHYAILGGHAICYIGWNDATKYFCFKNSWSEEWGDHGYGYQSYDDVALNLLEAFTITL